MQLQDKENEWRSALTNLSRLFGHCRFFFFFFLKRTNEAHSSEGMGESEKLDLAHIFIWDIKMQCKYGNIQSKPFKPCESSEIHKAADNGLFVIARLLGIV